MEPDLFKSNILRLARTTRQMLFSSPESLPGIRTKLGGIPWWPQGITRPSCSSGHQMAFIAQVSLSDVPGLNSSGLLSFHYCLECVYEGSMAFGHGFDGAGYRVDVFPSSQLVARDHLGQVAETVVPDCSVAFRGVIEIPTPDDAGINWEDLPFDYAENKTGDLDENVYPGLVHVARSKVGGWPTWVQAAQWPDDDPEAWMFVVQLDYEVGEEVPWAGGG